MSLSVEFIQRASKEIARAKEFKMSDFDFADQILQLIQELKQLMKKPPTNKEEEDYFDNRFPAILEELNKIIDARMVTSELLWLMELPSGESTMEPSSDEEWMLLDLAMELQGCLMSMYYRWYNFILKFYKFGVLARQADGYETYFKISAQSLEQMHIAAKEIKTVAKAYDEKIATVEKHLEAVRN